MSQTPNEPRGNSADDSPEPANETTPVASSEPTVRYPRVNQTPAASEQPTASYASSDAPAAHSQWQPGHNGSAYGSPYGTAPQGPENYPIPPEKRSKNKKSYSGSVLIAGMVAAALVGGVTAAGTTYVMNDDAGSSSVTNSTSQGVVINNPDSVTEVTAAAAKASPSVVTLEVSGNGSSGSGSGIVLDKSGNILTNTHVVTLGGEVADPSISVQMNDGSVHSATVVGTDPLSDLAVINIQAEGLVPATLGSSADLNVGDSAVAIGAPLGLSGTVTDGIISTLNRTISVASSAVPKESDQGEGGDGNQFNFQFPGQEKEQQRSSGSIYVNVIQTDAAINHGNSGGALVNANGEIIGVNVAIASSGSSEEGGSIGVGFAIPIDYAKRVAQELIDNGVATHGLLGATVTPQGPAESDQQSRSSFSVGARIVEVSADSAAEKAGLKSGDVITGVNGRAVQDSQTVTAAIREIPAGGEAKITYLRNGQEETATTTVGTLSNG
ncbi:MULTISPECIES: S1C family serine protease [Glutamicibacter]|uniref:S1C family serine protease n=1 Tax=Glutamicibacter TaxID=1742989 RepID=UPI000ECFDD08|nr:trypsin-like peptidase domain-containing protein [Glutamicibacter sp.]HCJ55003.1 serine protease [Glutamicibacter sp.]